MPPLIRNYIKLEYTVKMEEWSAMLTYSNLLLDYIEEEIYEGSRGPLHKLLSTYRFKVPGEFGKAILFYKKAESSFYEYDFVLQTDLSKLNETEDGADLIKTPVLPYDNHQIKPEERENFLMERGIYDYIHSHMAASFQVDTLRALELIDEYHSHMAAAFQVDILRALKMTDKYPSSKDSNRTKKKYLKNLIKKLNKKNFLPVDMKYADKPSSPVQLHKEISMHGGFLYDALETIIEKAITKIR